MLERQTPEFSSEAEFRGAVAAVLDALLEQIDAVPFDDLDPSLSEGNLQVVFEDSGVSGGGVSGGGVSTGDVPDGSSVLVLSQQTPTHELWLSANLTAWHFRREAGRWSERDSGEPLTAVLSALFSQKVGFEVSFEL